MTDPSAGAPELRATYRLQLGPSLDFAHARALVPYLRDLGISHLYLSPSLQARPGSTHGYDVVDPGRMSDALGGDSGFRALAAEVRGAGMGIVLDIVPNHMAADPLNRLWADPRLREQFFDVDPVTGRHRRFFDVDDLAGVRQEDPEVFEATHAFVLGLVSEGLIDGLRIDHPDGLADPSGYLETLRERGSCRVWVEKILGADERLPDWPVAGTVGYEFLNDVCALFVDPAGEPALTALWQQVSGDGRPFGSWALEAKLKHARTTFTPEIERLERLAPGLAGQSIALAASMLPVYRTYVEPGGGDFITRFQQTTPALTAKGVEDTAFYRYGRLLALNEVGGDPARFGLSIERFHADCAERASRFPEGLLATMTHDAKRSGDVRARLVAIAGMAGDWRTQVERWMAASEPFRAAQGAPDDLERYFIFQTLVGVWPIERERLQGYFEKALREAKRNTSWVSPNPVWEAGVQSFVSGLTRSPEFVTEFEPFIERAAAAGRRIALAMLALKLTCPGVPDIYQGDELEYRALVDPDNRRPVDWPLRESRLAFLSGGGRPGEDAWKLWMTSRLLGLRARRPAPFGVGGGYEQLDAGAQACAFVRGGDVLTVAGLRADAAGGELRDAPGGRWREVLTGDERSFARKERLSDLVGPAGVAIYERL